MLIPFVETIKDVGSLILCFILITIYSFHVKSEWRNIPSANLNELLKDVMWKRNCWDWINQGKPCQFISLEKADRKEDKSQYSNYLLDLFFLLQIVNVRRLWEEAVKSKRHIVSRSKPPFLMVWKLYWALTMEGYLPFLGLSVSTSMCCF